MNACVSEVIQTRALKQVQGDHSGSVKPPVDTKTKVAFYYIGLILKQNFCFEVNGRFVTTWMVNLYVYDDPSSPK